LPIPTGDDRRLTGLATGKLDDLCRALLAAPD
jgi:hypothetical protein